MPPCVFFAKGTCRHGQECIFDHERDFERPGSPYSFVRSPCTFYQLGHCSEGADCLFEHTKDGPRSKKPCKYFREGYCKNDRCPFSHVHYAEPSEAPSPGPRRYEIQRYEIQRLITQSPTHQLVVRTNSPVCKYWLQGRCESGAKCLFVHTTARVSADPVSTPGIPRIREYQEMYVETIEQNRLLFGATVSFGDGANIVTIKLPIDFSTVMIKGPIAKVTRGGIERLLTSLGFSATATPYHTYIYPRTKTAIARVRAEDSGFGTQFLEKFEATSKLVGDELSQGLKAKMASPTEDRHATDPRVTFCKVKLWWPHRRGDVAARASIGSLITGAGAIDVQDLPTDSEHCAVMAQFLSESDARLAVSHLDVEGHAYNFMKGDQLDIQLIASAKYRIRTVLFNYLRMEIFALTSWTDKHSVTLKTHQDQDALEKFTVLEFESPNHAAMVNIVSSLEALIQPVQLEDTPFWSRALFSEEGLQDLESVQVEHNVLILRDGLKERLQCYGPSDRLSSAQQTLAARYSESPRLYNKLALPPPLYVWLLTEGINTIIAKVGLSAVTVNTAVTPKTLTIRGDEPLIRNTLTHINAMADAAAEGVHGIKDCAICWIQPKLTDAVRTSCGHIYHHECFRDMCLAGSGSFGFLDFCVRCQGNTGCCLTPIRFAHLQEFLSSADLDEVLRKTLASYLSQHQTEYRKCPNSGCGFINRIASDGQGDVCFNCTTTSNGTQH